MSTQEKTPLTPGMGVVAQNVLIKNMKFQGPIRGTLKSIKGEETVVEFRIPVRPFVCADCGSPAHLSMNGASGTVVCLRSGCGHDHGFETVSVDYIAASALMTAEEYGRLVLQGEWQEKVKTRRMECEWANNALAEILEEGKKNGWRE